MNGQLRRIRQAKGITQVQLAERTGLVQQYISRIENGKVVPRTTTLAKIASGLDVPVSDLIAGDA